MYIIIQMILYILDMSNNMFRKESPRAKLLQDLRHTYMPSLFDAEAIKHRNMKMEEVHIVFFLK